MFNDRFKSVCLFIKPAAKALSLGLAMLVRATKGGLFKNLAPWSGC